MDEPVARNSVAAVEHSSPAEIGEPPTGLLDDHRHRREIVGLCGVVDHGVGELSDAAAALDWAQTINPEARSCWISGFSFGSWIGMQLLMRRPEVEGFISIAPPANLYDFSFLAPCPSSGLIVHGERDAVVPPKDVNTLVEKLKTQKGIVIDQQVIPGANHFFDGKLEPLMESVTGYLDMRLANVR